MGYLQLGRMPRRRSWGPGRSATSYAAIKRVADTKVGDTVLDAENRASELLPGYKEVKPMVFAGLYPTDTEQYEELRDALEKLKLNDASLNYEPETSAALGFGFRCGFLGLLHMEIIQERLEREFGLDLITTVPNVEYRLVMTNGEVRGGEPLRRSPTGRASTASRSRTCRRASCAPPTTSAASRSSATSGAASSAG